MYSRPFYINCSDVDEYRHLKPSALFKLFQDTAVESVEATGYGDKWMNDHKLMWVITRVNAEIITTPKYQQDVTLITYPKETMRVIYPRHFFIKDKDNNILVRMSTTWALLDQDSRSIANLDPKDLPLDVDSLENELPLPRKLKVNEGEKVLSRTVRYADCDLNGHLNNTRYIDFIFDLFDSNFYKDHVIYNIQIDYLSEIKEKEVVDLYLSQVDSDFDILGKVNDKVAFIAKLRFKINSH